MSSLDSLVQSKSHETTALRSTLNPSVRDMIQCVMGITDGLKIVAVITSHHTM